MILFYYIIAILAKESLEGNKARVPSSG